MIYYNINGIVVRDLEPDDPQRIYDGELEQGWHPDIEVYRRRLIRAEAGEIIALTADFGEDKAVGHINIFLHPDDGPFGADIPMIVDFAVLEKFRRKGIGKALMDAAENIAAGYSDKVCLGVGLHSGYGAAQRIYAKRGYIPDGGGVWYKGKIHPQYAGGIVNDDDLVIWLIKELRK